MRLKPLAPSQLSDLSREEAVAYDVASALCRGGNLPEATYRTAVATFGETGLAELAFLVGSSYDAAVPGSDDMAIS